MRTALALAIACVCLATPTGQTHTHKPGEFFAYGPTDLSCGAFTSSGNLRSVYEWWALGFVSGASRTLNHQGDSLQETDAAGIRRWVDKYCAAHPLDPYVTAIIKLVDELHGRFRQAQ